MSEHPLLYKDELQKGSLPTPLQFFLRLYQYFCDSTPTSRQSFHRHKKREGNTWLTSHCGVREVIKWFISKL